MNRRKVLAATAVVAPGALGVAAVAVTGFGGRQAAEPVRAAKAPATAEVTRQTLVDYRGVSGTLG